MRVPNRHQAVDLDKLAAIAALLVAAALGHAGSTSGWWRIRCRPRRQALRNKERNTVGWMRGCHGSPPGLAPVPGLRDHRITPPSGPVWSRPTIPDGVLP